MIFDFIDWLGDFIYYGTITLFVPRTARDNWIWKRREIHGQELRDYHKSFRGRCVQWWS